MASTVTELSHLQIPLDDIVKATNNFADENIIGKGGFGNVYKGQLIRSGKLLNISARRLDRRHGQGDVEFWTEIAMLSSLKDEYIVSMIGFCDEKNEKIIICHHYAKGSLLMYLSDPTSLTWMQRLHIALYVAHAINYIQREKGRSYYVIHRNINSSTILLDGNMNPKLSGFEFSIKHSVDRKSQVLLCDAIGTRGYMDPEIVENGGVTHKSDVYSFGVVLFELLCGRKANEELVRLARFHYENGTLQDIIHPDLWNQMVPESFKLFSKAAYSCLEEKRSQRIEARELGTKLDHAYVSQFTYENKDQIEKDAELMPDDEESSDEVDILSSLYRKDETDPMQMSLEEELGDAVDISPSLLWQVENDAWQLPEKELRDEVDSSSSLRGKGLDMEICHTRTSISLTN